MVLVATLGEAEAVETPSCARLAPRSPSASCCVSMNQRSQTIIFWKFLFSDMAEVNASIPLLSSITSEGMDESRGMIAARHGVGLSLRMAPSLLPAGSEVVFRNPHRRRLTPDPPHLLVVIGVVPGDGVPLPLEPCSRG